MFFAGLRFIARRSQKIESRVTTWIYERTRVGRAVSWSQKGDKEQDFDHDGFFLILSM